LRVLFINSNMKKLPFLAMPLGLCYVASNLKGHKVDFLDLAFVKNVKREIISRLRKFRPDFICIGIRNIDNADYFRNHFYLEEIRDNIVKTIKDNSDAKVIAGGAAFSINPREILDYLRIDYGVCGEGEGSLGRLINAINGKEKISDINGAVYRCKGEIKMNGISRIRDLRKIHPPDISRWIDIDKYRAFGARLSIQTKRGCNQKCVYCVYNKLEGNNIRMRSPKDVVDEIEHITSITKIYDVEFVDSVFNIPITYSKRICSMIIKEGIKVRLYTSNLNAGHITPELIGLMEDAGFKEVWVTPDTGSEKMLKSLRKGFDKKCLVKSAEILSESKLDVMWCLLFGGPSEDSDTVNETINFIKKHISKKHLVFCYIGIRIYSHTPLAEVVLSKEKINVKDNFLHPCFYHSKLIKPKTIRNKVLSLEKKTSNVIFLDMKPFMLKFPAMVFLVLAKYFNSILRRDFSLWKEYLKINNIRIKIKSFFSIDSR